MNSVVPRSIRRKLCVACITFAIASLLGCQGLRNSSTTPPAPAVALNQTAVNLAVGATTQFTATVMNETNTSVSWAVDSISGGNAAVGTISATGLYTAPAKAGSHTVTATSVAASSASAKATVAVGSLSLTPATLLVATANSQQFTATIQGFSNTGVTWSVDNVSGGNSTVGTITATGLYTAPAQAGSHNITAVSAVDASLAASSTVTIFLFTITPTSSIVAPSANQQFIATVQGLSNNGVTWSVDGVNGGNSTTGTVSPSGLYTAPSAVGPHVVAATSVGDTSANLSAVVTVINAKQTAVLTYHNDDARDGAYLEEVTLTPANVNAAQFGKIMSYPVDGQVYAQPLYLPQITINGAKHDVVYVATQNNTLYAFDAVATATTPVTFWQVNFGPSVPKFDFEGVNPNVGILATPVIDASTNTIYLVAETSNTGQNGSPFFLHAVDAITGLDRQGSPVAINATYNGDALETSCYQRMGLALNPVTNFIYMTFGSCTHGWVLAYDKSSLAQKAAFDDTAGQNPGGGGFWSGGGAPAIDDATGDIFVMSGVDAGDQNDVQLLYNDSFLNLNANTLAVKTFFAPDNNLTLAQNDADLGSGSPALIPGNLTYPREIVGGGKDGNVYVLDPANMGGYSGTNMVLQNLQTGVSQYDNIFSTPVYWNGLLFYHSAEDVLRVFTWNAGEAAGLQMAFSAKAGAVFGPLSHGATASLSANGAMNGIVWDIDNSTYVGNNPLASGHSVLHAYEATNVTNELYNSSQAANNRDQAGTALKFTVPTIANGRVFVPTANELDIYGLVP